MPSPGGGPTRPYRERLQGRVSRESAAINARAGMASIPARPRVRPCGMNWGHVRTCGSTARDFAAHRIVRARLPRRAMTMGRWFPGFRTGTPEQCAAYRAAVFDLHLNSLYQQRAGIRTETPRYTGSTTGCASWRSR